MSVLQRFLRVADPEIARLSHSALPEPVPLYSPLTADSPIVLCTQPRRIAAISVAERVAQERGQAVGHEVGYQV